MPRRLRVRRVVLACLAGAACSPFPSAPAAAQALAAARPSPSASTPAAVDAADVVYRIDPADPSSYRYGTLACLGANRYAWVWDASRGRPLEPGPFPLVDAAGTLRAGVVPDPDDASRQAFELSVLPTDADTAGAGAKRCEIALGWTEYDYPGKVPRRRAALPRNQDFWWVIGFRLDDWRGTSDRQVVFQWLAGGALGAGPMLTLQTQGERMWLTLQHDHGVAPAAAPAKAIAWTLRGWQPHHWYTLALRARIDDRTPADGRLAIWLDGRQVLDYRGPIGLRSPAGSDYAKFGLYHWTRNNPWDLRVVRRTAWYRGAALIRAGKAYDAAGVARLLE